MALDHATDHHGNTAVTHICASNRGIIHEAATTETEGKIDKTHRPQTLLNSFISVEDR